MDSWRITWAQHGALILKSEINNDLLISQIYFSRLVEPLISRNIGAAKQVKNKYAFIKSYVNSVQSLQLQL